MIKRCKWSLKSQKTRFFQAFFNTGKRLEKMCFSRFSVVCSLKCFFKKLIMWFCRESNSEQLLILNFMLKIRSHSSGNRRNFGKMSGIFVPSSKEFLSFSKIWLYLTLKNAISCHLRQKIEKMAPIGNPKSS